MEKLITDYIKSDFILYSGLDPQWFAKTYMSHLTDEQGILFTFKKDKVDWEYWHFDETITAENGQVVYRGNFEKGVNLHQIIFSEDKNRTLYISHALKAIDNALENNIDLKNVGAGGIMCSNDKDTVRILFLPAELFEQSSMNTNQTTYSDLQGKYLRKGLTGKKALMFTRAAIAYTALTGEFPYKENDTNKRQSDIIDSLFVPLELKLYDIDINFAGSIDAGLSLKADFTPLPGERKFESKKEIKERELINNYLKYYSTETVESELKKNAEGTRKAPENAEAFKKAETSYMNRKLKITKVHRLFRRNSKLILTGLAVFAVIFYAGYSWIDSFRDHASTIGLTSEQTAQLLYSSIHNEDPVILSDISKGKVMEEMDLKISSMYVMNREREFTNQDAGTVTPAQWLFFTKGTTFWQYGLTNLKVNGKPVRTDMEIPTRRHHGESVRYENGRVLADGITKDVTVEYYFVYYTGPTLNTVKEKDIVTLTYKSDHWIVTNVKVDKADHKMIKLQTFLDDYERAVKMATAGDKTDVKRVASSLRSKYQWIPTETELEIGARRMVERFNNSAAKRYLGM